ncbi:carbohydrate ABC transporter permease [Paenibacillus humicola]|uniref:carbohydrate ABC transporter permease n=1 Tax=Paenibacillus humicola TaxID=3110540 RepID=UPI00237A3780|nr:carbohydrate ABC transporter permease [Paenibacillus humicola]
MKQTAAADRTNGFAIASRMNAGRLFTCVNYLFLACAGALCVFPVLHILAVSLSSAGPAAANRVVVWPVDFTFQAYAAVFSRAPFITSFGVSIERTVVGVAVNAALTALMGYPLSKTAKELPGRNLYVWLLVFVMLFNAGLVPTYMLVKNLHLLNTLWALVLPGAVPIFSVILVMNFIKMLPKEIEEAAFIDGASYWMCWRRLILPLSKPVIATIVLFSFVGHWNSWYDGLIYMNDSKLYPLQTYLYTVIQNQDITSLDQAASYAEVNGVTLQSAQIFSGMVPILLMYPFLQKYFTKGIVLGAVKG